MKHGWPTQRLASITTKITDGSHNPPKGVPESDFLMLSSKNVLNDGLSYDDPRYLTAEQYHQEDKRTGVMPGDVLLTIVGTVGRCAVLPSNSPRITFQRSVAVVRPRTEIIEPRFLMYSFMQQNAELNEKARGVAQKGIYLETLRDLEVPVPPLPEQQRIVGILDEAFEGIATAKANAEKNLQNARALFDSHLQSVFSQRGDGWETTVLGEVCERVTVGHVGTTSPHYREQGIRFLRTQNVGASGLTLDDTKYVTPEFHASLKKSEVKAGDVLMSRVITHTVRCALIPSDLGPANCANVILVRPGKTLIPRFLVHYIRSAQAQRHLLDRKVGSAQLVVNTTVVKNWPIPLPPLSEQERIVEELDALGAETQRLGSIYQRKLAALDELKKSLLHQAFTGQLGTQAA